MRTYMIYTEDKNREAIEEILSSRLEGFTLIYGQGFWVSPTVERTIYYENSLIIVILTNDGEVIRDIAREIKKANNQESVMVTSFKTEREMI